MRAHDRNPKIARGKKDTGEEVRRMMRIEERRDGYRREDGPRGKEKNTGGGKIVKRKGGKVEKRERG